MKEFAVRTADVDGSSTRRYATLAGAVKRFEEMAGYTVDQVIADQHDGPVYPTLAKLQYLRGVSPYGTVVVLTKPVTPEPAAPVDTRTEDQQYEAYCDMLDRQPLRYDALPHADDFWGDDIPF